MSELSPWRSSDRNASKAVNSGSLRYSASAIAAWTAKIASRCWRGNLRKSAADQDWFDPEFFTMSVAHRAEVFSILSLRNLTTRVIKGHDPVASLDDLASR